MHNVFHPSVRQSNFSPFFFCTTTLMKPQQNFVKRCCYEEHTVYRCGFFIHYFFRSYAPLELKNIRLWYSVPLSHHHHVQYCQTMLERWVSELAHSFFHIPHEICRHGLNTNIFITAVLISINTTLYPSFVKCMCAHYIYWYMYLGKRSGQIGPLANIVVYLIKTIRCFLCEFLPVVINT